MYPENIETDARIDFTLAKVTSQSELNTEHAGSIPLFSLPDKYLSL